MNAGRRPVGLALFAVAPVRLVSLFVLFVSLYLCFSALPAIVQPFLFSFRFDFGFLRVLTLSASAFSGALQTIPLTR